MSEDRPPSGLEQSRRRVAQHSTASSLVLRVSRAWAGEGLVHLLSKFEPSSMHARCIAPSPRWLSVARAAPKSSEHSGSHQ